MSKVIVVDDDANNIRLIKMLLEMDGFSVIACTNIADARAAATEEVQAFVVDCNLARGANGLDLLHAVRANELPVPNNTTVIMTSGDYRRSHEAEAAGADLFLLKPYSPNALSVELQKRIDRGEKK